MLERSPEEEPAAVRVVRRARRLAERSAQRRATALAAHGIDQGQLDVLEALVAVGQPFRLTAGELTRACGVTPGATSQRLTVMERSGLVERVREEPDRRTVHVQLTATGRARVDEVADDVRAADVSAVQGLGPDELAALDRALAAWTAAWDDTSSESRYPPQRESLR